MTGSTLAPSAKKQIDLTVEGMTCASCVSRVERKLAKLDDVSASVNLATATAHVEYPASVTPAQLIEAVHAAGYKAQPAPSASESDTPGESAPSSEDRSIRNLRRRLLGSALLGAPVIAVSMAPALQFDYWQWCAFALATPIALWGGWPFHRAAAANLRHGATTMDTLVSMGVLASWTWSAYALLFGGAGEQGMRMTFSFFAASQHGPELYLEVAAALVIFILAGRYVEARSRRRAGEAIRALAGLGAREVSLLRDGREERIAVDQLRVGDEFVVRPGEKVATDGVVIEGSATIDESLLTGESLPAEIGVGSPVTGATLNSGGRLVVRATRVGAETTLAHLTRLVEQAQAGKAQVQHLADRVSAVFVPIVITLALATLAGWLLIGESHGAALTAAVAVLVVACPCVLGLATPMALMVGVGRGAQLGLLIRGPEVLESTKRLDTIVLDKTGTVTEGRAKLVDSAARTGKALAQLLRLAGAVEVAAEHPIAQAIAAAAAREGQLPPVTEFRAERGAGASGVVEGRSIRVGRASWLRDHARAIPAELAAFAERAEQAGQSVVFISVADNTDVSTVDDESGSTVDGAFAVSDAVRATSAQAVAQLRALGLHPMLLTGDNAPAARAVAAEVGIAQVVAEVRPEDKVAEVRRLQQAGKVVAMVGDGVNDAAALATADLGLAMGGGTDAAMAAADLTLVHSDLRAASDAIRLARRTLTTIKQNLCWAFGYNVVALPLAALGLLNPMIAGAAMAFSSLTVVGNSLRLRRFRPAP